MHAEFGQVNMIETENFVYTDPSKKGFILATLFSNTLMFLYIVARLILIVNLAQDLYACSDYKNMKE